MAKLFLRINLHTERVLGPGKVRLLELIDELGSISAASRAMGMTYRRAWMLIDETNRCFSEPVVRARTGGRAGGGAEVTRLGRDVALRYRAIERETEAVVATHLAALEAAQAGAPGEAGKSLACRGHRRDRGRCPVQEPEPAGRWQDLCANRPASTPRDAKSGSGHGLRRRASGASDDQV